MLSWQLLEHACGGCTTGAECNAQSKAGGRHLAATAHYPAGFALQARCLAHVVPFGGFVLVMTVEACICCGVLCSESGPGTPASDVGNVCLLRVCLVEVGQLLQSYTDGLDLPALSCSTVRAT